MKLCWYGHGQVSILDFNVGDLELGLGIDWESGPEKSALKFARKGENFERI